MAALTLLTRAPFLGHPAPDYDEQLYSLIGQAMLHGQVPYVDLWDRKPPGLFLVFAAAHALLGPGALAYQLVALAACLAGGWLCWRLARRIAAPATAAFAACLYPLLMALYGSHSGQSEIFLMVPAMAMAELVLAARTRPDPLPLLAAAMAAGGLALQIKYTLLPVCLWFGLVALATLHRRGWRMSRRAAAATLFALLGLLPTALAAGWYALDGHLADFVFANFLSIGRRAPMPLRYTLAKQVIYILPLLLLALGGAVHGRVLHRMRTNAVWWIALGWLAFALAGLFMGTTVYPYYYAALVPPVILVALPLLDCTRPLGRATLAGLMLWLLAIYNPPHLLAEATRERAALARMAALAAPHVQNPAHPLWVYDGPVALYRLAGSALPTRIIYPDHLNNALEARALPVDPVTEVRRVLALRPGAIVTSPHPVTVRNEATAREVAAALAAHYRLAGTDRFTDRPIEIWLANASLPDSVSKSSKLPAYGGYVDRARRADQRHGTGVQ